MYQSESPLQATGNLGMCSALFFLKSHLCKLSLPTALLCPFPPPHPPPVPDLTSPLHSGFTWKGTSALFLFRTQKAAPASENGQHEPEERRRMMLFVLPGLSQTSLPHKVFPGLLIHNQSLSLCVLQHFYLSSPKVSSTPSVGS